ncbi:MAG TPA: sulfite exporter TauE/SafE family protein [Beijerinckiaceae bacterium]|nr:sulfite exporter TauE/SafE family protein [Beijerinckiaceae bacterium]
MAFHAFLDAFTASLFEPRSWLVVAIVLVAGLVRGFSGFGGAQIFIPLVSAVLGPKTAVPLFYLCDMFTSSPYGLRFIRECRWREIAPLVAGSLLMLPIGAWLLRSFNPLALRWAIDILVLAIVALLVSGWRYSRKPRPRTSFAVGIGAGFTGGATGLSGPLVIAYWLGSRADAFTARLNIMVFYSINSLYTDVIYFFEGLFTMQTVVRALLIGPAYAFGLWSGIQLFRRSSDRHYRRIAFTLIALAAVLGMPVFDRWMH